MNQWYALYVFLYSYSYVFGFPYPEPVVIQWQPSGNSVCLELRPQWTLVCYWRKSCWWPVCFQCASSGLPAVFQWWSSVLQLCKLTLDCHWDTTGCSHQPVWFHWHPSVLVAPVDFQCVPIMQINTGLPWEDHWVITSASVVPVQSVSWHSNVLRASGLVIRSGHFPACNPLCIQLVCGELFELRWFHLYCDPKYTQTYNGAHIGGTHRVMWKYSHIWRAELVCIEEQ